jgi:nucleoside-diphosphate-sugar epimerase
MKVLVTGGAGYLGSILVRLLLAKDDQVRVMDNLMYGRGSLSDLSDRKGFHLVEADLRDSNAVASALHDVDAVVHLAAIVGDPACTKNPDLARAVNMQASLNLIDAALLAGVSRFVFASTCSNYGRIADTSTPVDEDHELKPVSLYAETKVAVEQALLARSSDQIASTILRFATLYGVSPRMRFDLTVNEFVKSMSVDRKLVVYGEQFWRPYVHVFDAARAIATVLDAPTGEVAGKVFNVGETQENYRKADLVEIIRERVGLVDVEYVSKAEDPRDYKVSFERIRAGLGYEVTRRVKDGVEEILQALKSVTFLRQHGTAAYNVASSAAAGSGKTLSPEGSL